MKTLKFRPASFVEVDDQKGGRKVVLVCKDGVTYWDLADSSRATPIVFHSVMKPVDIGTLAEFVKAKKIDKVCLLLIEHMKRKGDERFKDPLYFMRAIWFVEKKVNSDKLDPDEVVLAYACEQANRQEKDAAQVQKLAEQFCSS